MIDSAYHRTTRYYPRCPGRGAGEISGTALGFYAATAARTSNDDTQPMVFTRTALAACIRHERRP